MYIANVLLLLNQSHIMPIQIRKHKIVWEPSILRAPTKPHMDDTVIRECHEIAAHKYIYLTPKIEQLFCMHQLREIHLWIKWKRIHQLEIVKKVKYGH